MINLIQLTDKELAKAAKNGFKEAAFAELHRRYYPRLTKHLSMMLNNREEAEDQIQNTFIKVWKNIGTYEEKNAEFSTWVYSIALNNAIDALRKRKTGKRPLFFENIEAAYDLEQRTFPSPEEEIGIEEINRIIRTLPIKYSEALILRNDGKTYKEIVSILQIPIGTVRSRLNRANIMFMNKYNQRRGCKNLHFLLK